MTNKKANKEIPLFIVIILIIICSLMGLYIGMETTKTQCRVEKANIQLDHIEFLLDNLPY